MIKLPIECPSCGSTLKLVNDQLFCKNRLCPAQSLMKIEHFCKSLKMKGFGPSSLEKLGFEYITDIFSFSESYFLDTLGSTVGAKLYKEVRNAQASTTLDRVIAGLSIPLIGETLAKKLAGVIDTFDDIDEEVCKLAGLGDKATLNVLEYLESEEYEHNKKLLNSFKPFSNISVKSNNIKVCITGKLEDFKNRNDAAKYLESFGYTVVDSVTKSTNVLINEDTKSSSKLDKAIALGIRVTTIKEFLKELN